jgi:hypothetical protein
VLNSVTGVSKNVASTCFGHYWSSSEGAANIIKKLLYYFVVEHGLLLQYPRVTYNSYRNSDYIVNTVKVVNIKSYNH